ncbi:MAG TPA: NAD(P)/FAD-dependent oxidoreductase [Solirubrobacteraceae bacterium]|nr:NAD(P)/FAD-dependent oxidoreductase [Solirubrobacteraceae bacterium]
MNNVQQVRIAIVGSGFAGLGMAIRLRQEGIEDFVVLERAGDLGGTWRDNSYPGCACDVPSHLYSFSFAPNPDWTSTFSPQPEIWDYLRRCAQRYGVTDHIRFDHEVLEAAWDADAQRWHVETSQGPLTAEVLVMGTGPLSAPAIPDLPGLDRFEGATFHSATWDHDHDLGGERIAVIGTGASAIQFVPKIAPQAERLHVFQRTAPWIMPRPDRPLRPWERRLYRALPGAQLLMRAGIYWAREGFVVGFRHPRVMRHAERLALRHLGRQVRDPDLRRRLTPSYRMGCKRVLISNDYLPALTRPNVDLITDRIAEVRARSIVTADGAEREVDAIIFGTGFHVTDMPAAERVHGADGRTLAEHWRGTPQAHLGAMVAGYPNLFFLVGPNTGLGHNSIVFMIESQCNYVLSALRLMDERGAAELDARPEAQAAYNARLQERMRGTVWTSGGCASWYLDANGRNSTLWPTFTWPFRERTRRLDPAEYTMGARRRDGIASVTFV